MLTAEQMATMSPEQIAAYFAAMQTAPANVKKPNIGKLFNQGSNSSFPNITETYKCKFLRYEDITAGERKFKLIFVSATNSRDETEELSTIVQKATITADMANEIFVVNTTEQPDKRYPKVEAVED